MKVKHSRPHTTTFRCDLVMTIKRCGNAPEHDDLSALSWPCVFLKVMWLQMIPHFINKNFLPCLFLWELKNYFLAQLSLLRVF